MQKHLHKIFYSIILLNLSIFFYLTISPSSTINNYRLIFNANAINCLIDKFQGQTNLCVTADDPSFSILYAATTSVKLTTNVAPSNFPVPFRLFFLGVHLAVLVFLTNSYRRRPSGNTLLLNLILLHPNIIALYQSFDVYLFPVYTLVLLLSFNSIGQKSWLDYLALITIIVVFDTFRVTSLYFLLVYLIYVLFLTKKYNKKVLYISLLYLILLKTVISTATNSLLKSNGHNTWHTIHAGLFEQGGCISKDGKSYPFYIHDRDKINMADMSLCSNGWNDSLEYQYAKLNQCELYSPCYKNILQNDYIQTIKQYPSETISFYTYKLINIMNIFSFSYIKTGEFTGFSVYHFLLIIASISLFSIMAYRNRVRLKLEISLLCISFIPPMLSHSAHVIYNMPTHYVLWYLILFYFSTIAAANTNSFKKILTLKK